MSALWRYTAIASGGAKRRGELTGESAAEVRASLRRIGLQVIELSPLRGTGRQIGVVSHQRALTSFAAATGHRWHQHLLTRRRPQRAELFDGLATMLESGLPLLEAVETLLESNRSRASRVTRRFLRDVSSGERAMLVRLREGLRGGSSLHQAIDNQPSWFDGTEVAMVRAAQHAGNLAPVLRRLARQHERSGELGQKVASALAYPSVIAVVGLGVAIFLSVKTLPDLSRILEGAGLQVPTLTERVMNVGQFIARWWPMILTGAALSFGALCFVPAVCSRRAQSRCAPDLTPRVLRRIAVAGFSLRFSELLKSGIPVVEALRVLAPTVSSRVLRSKLMDAAERVERGDELCAALGDQRWFDREYTRLLEIGQASGELDVLLERVGRRYERTARRLIDRLASLLEPCVILALAVLIGIVVMAAILPLTRLQEVLR